MAFSKAFIDELKSKNNLDEIVSRYVSLKRSGSNLKGLCPFHSERTPSFTLFGQERYTCFGCGAGGDVITFVMQMENLDYKEAIQYLADRAGLKVPEQNDYYIKPDTISRERNFAINKAAAKLFHANLMSQAGKDAYKYLTDRGLTKSTIIHFGLGFALNDFSHTLDHLISQGFTKDEAKQAFLCGISKNGKPYDYFRNRIIFPIIDTSGNIVAFGGRVMDDSLPKYLNTSDTPVFKKSKTLFAYNFAKSIINSPDYSTPYCNQGDIILCEGYMDVISLHQAGFCNAVATLGTAITSEHARIISRSAKKVYLCYDSDSAGKKAADRALTLLNEVGLETKVLHLDNAAKDPDEYIKKFGALEFSKLLKKSSGQVDFRLNRILSKYDLSVPDEKLRAIEESCEMLSSVFPEYKREIYAIRLSEISGVSKEMINSEIRRKSNFKKKKHSSGTIEKAKNSLLHYDDKINKEASKCYKAVTIEERIIGILMLSPEFFNEIKIEEDIFVTEFNKKLFSILKRLNNENTFDIAYLNEYYSPEEVGRINSMLQKRAALTVNGKEILIEQIDMLKKEKAKLFEESSDDFASEFEKLRKEKI